MDSLDVQTDKAREFVESHGWRIDASREFVEREREASRAEFQKRPALISMLNAAAAGRAAVPELLRGGGGAVDPARSTTRIGHGTDVCQ